MQRNIWELAAHGRHRIVDVAGEFRMCASRVTPGKRPAPFLARLRYGMATLLIDLARMLAGRDALLALPTNSSPPRHG